MSSKAHYGETVEYALYEVARRFLGIPQNIDRERGILLPPKVEDEAKIRSLAELLLDVAERTELETRRVATGDPARLSEREARLAHAYDRIEVKR